MKRKTLTRYAKKFLLSETGKKLIAENIVLFFNNYFMPTLINELNKTYPHAGEWKFMLTNVNFSEIEVMFVRERISHLQYVFDFTCPSADDGVQGMRFTLQSPNHTIDVSFLSIEGHGWAEVVEKNEKGIPTTFDISMLYILRMSVKIIIHQEELRHYSLVHIGKIEKDIGTPKTKVEVYDGAMEQLVHSLGKIVLPWVEGKGGELRSWLRDFVVTFWTLWRRKNIEHIEMEKKEWLGKIYRFSIEIITHIPPPTPSPFSGEIEIYSNRRGDEFVISYTPKPPFVNDAKIVFHPSTEIKTSVYTFSFTLQPQLVLRVEWTKIKINGAIEITTSLSRKKHVTTLWIGDMEEDENLVIPQWNDPQLRNALNSLIEKGIHLIADLIEWGRIAKGIPTN